MIKKHVKNSQVENFFRFATAKIRKVSLELRGAQFYFAENNRPYLEFHQHIVVLKETFNLQMDF